MKKLFINNHVKLQKELHPTKNNNIDFSVIYENSGRKVWWICQKNEKHIWLQSITARTRLGYGCPYCSGRLTLPEESLAALYPSIASELHPTKNLNFDPSKIRPTSIKKIWWICKNGHEWQQKILTRTSSKFGCKVCKKHEWSIVNRHPLIAKEWHPIKNKPLKAIDFTASSNEKVWWQCSEGHEWQTQIRSRASSGSICPICSRKKNNLKSLPSLAKYNPDLSKEWHPTKNRELIPENITAGSTKKVWWICSIDSTHEWEATVNNRNRGKGCPYCANQVANPKKTLLACFPQLSNQWHPTKNGALSPSNVSYGSSKNIWWQCTDNSTHEWQATIASRTQQNKTNKLKCPICAKDKELKTNTLQIVHPEIAAEWHPTKNENLSPSQVTRASGKKVWWQCPERADHVWVAQIKNRTLLKAGCPHCSHEKNALRVTEHLYDLFHDDIDYYHVFLGNLRATENLAKLTIREKRSSRAFYKMLYTSVITSLETYLSDAFLWKTQRSQEVVEKLITTNPEFNKKQYALSDLINWNKNIDKKVTEYLLNIIWHNIPKVQAMYKSVLGVTFPSNIEVIFKAIAIRHDLVHRSGKDKSGKFHNINQNSILNLIQETKKFVNFINVQL